MTAIPDPDDERAPLSDAAAFLADELELPCIGCEETQFGPGEGDEIAPHGINPELIEHWDER